jgi:ferredoxin
MIVKVEIDVPTCIGCGTCWVACPDVFREIEVGDDIKAEVTGKLCAEKQLLGAAEGCPSLSIVLTDDQGRTVYPTEAQREEQRRRLSW